MAEKKEDAKIYKRIDEETQTSPAIETPDGRVLTETDWAIEVLNKLDKIERNVG